MELETCGKDNDTTPNIVCADEVGLGALAGPFVVCAVMAPIDTLKVREARDSKKMSQSAKDACFNILKEHEKLLFRIGMSDAKEIDDLGFSEAKRLAFRRALDPLITDNTKKIRIDGDYFNLKFGPKVGKIIEFIPKGDDKDWRISAASVVAKVLRDEHMLHLHKKHPEYGWKSNSGYGTKEHVKAIHKFGYVEGVHRTSFRLPKLK